MGQLVKFDVDKITDSTSSGETVTLPNNLRNFNVRFGFALTFGRIRESVKQSNTSLK